MNYLSILFIASTVEYNLKNSWSWPQTLQYCVLHWYFPIHPTTVSWKNCSDCDNILCWTKYDCQKGSVALKQRQQCPAPIPGEEGHCPAGFDEGRMGFHRAHGWKKPIFVSPRTNVCPRAEKCMNIDKSMLICGNETERALWGSSTLCSDFMQGGILFVWTWTHRKSVYRNISSVKVTKWYYFHIITCIS